MKLTRNNIHDLFNVGAPNAPQRIALGLSWPLEKGWLTALIGREIPDVEYQRLMELKGPRPKGVPTKEWQRGAIKPAVRNVPQHDVEAEAWL